METKYAGIKGFKRIRKTIEWFQDPKNLKDYSQILLNLKEMSKVSTKQVYNAIKKTIGVGPHKLHEPYFSKKEIKLTNDTIKNFVSSAGEYGKNLKIN